VLQGLFIVVVFDYAAATVLSQQTIVASVLESLKVVKSQQVFEEVHQSSKDGMLQVSEASEAD